MTLHLLGDLIVLVSGFCFGQLVSREIVDFFRDQIKNFYAAKDMKDRFVSIVFSQVYVMISVIVAIFGYAVTPWTIRVLCSADIQPQQSLIDYIAGAALGIPLYLYLNRKSIRFENPLT